MNTSKLEDGEKINNNVRLFISFNLPLVMNINRYGVDCLCLSYESYQQSVSVLSSGSFKLVRCKNILA